MNLGIFATNASDVINKRGMHAWRFRGKSGKSGKSRKKESSKRGSEGSLCGRHKSNINERGSAGIFSSQTSVAECAIRYFPRLLLEGRTPLMVSPSICGARSAVRCCVNVVN